MTGAVGNVPTSVEESPPTSACAGAGQDTLWRRSGFHVAGLSILAVGTFAPYAFAGPALLRDDWFTIRNAELDRWWMAAGSSQWAARPVGAATYALTFGLIGQRPLVHYLLGAAVVTLVAVVLYVVAARFIPRLAAAALAAVWLVLPNHTSLEMWPSAFNIACSLLLLLLGVERLTRADLKPVVPWIAGALMAVGVLAYEAVGPVAVFVVLLLSWRQPTGERLRTALPPLLPLGLAGSWMVLNWHPEKKGLGQTLEPWFVVPGHFGYSITGDMTVARVAVPAAVLVVSAIAAYRLIIASERSSANWQQWCIAAGWAVIALGTLPFVRYFYAPIGFGDRVTVVSGVGGAIVLVAVVATLWRWWAPLGVAFALLLSVAMVGQRASMVMAYATASDDSRRVLAAIEDRWPEPPDHPMVFGPEVVDRHVRAFQPMEYPVQVLYGTTSVDVRNAYSVAELEEAPPEHRFDLREHQKLDDGRLANR